MIICFYIEVADKAEQCKVERAMAAPFIDAGKVSDLSLEAFDAERKAAQPTGEAGAEPSCHVCGSTMKRYWHCLGCGATTRVELSEAVSSPRSAEALCQGCKSGSLESFEHDDCLTDKVLDKELGRWQKAIYGLCRKHAIAPDCIDGGGTDSGDPLDFTLAEIGQVVCQLENPQDYRAALPGQPSPAPETNPEGIWVIMYAPTEHESEIFMGAGAETAARKRYAIAKLNWTCHLLCEVRPSQPSEGLEQVARDICREVYGPYMATVNAEHQQKAVDGILAILARHFSGGKPLVQSKGNDEWVRIIDRNEEPTHVQIRVGTEWHTVSKDINYDTALRVREVLQNFGAQFSGGKGADWIHTADRMPKHGEWCLVVIGGVVQRMSARLTTSDFSIEQTNYCWQWADEDADCAPAEAVTHWQPWPDLRPAALSGSAVEEPQAKNYYEAADGRRQCLIASHKTGCKCFEDAPEPLCANPECGHGKRSHIFENTQRGDICRNCRCNQWIEPISTSVKVAE